jgi:hypothetical protein
VVIRFTHDPVLWDGSRLRVPNSWRTGRCLQDDEEHMKVGSGGRYVSWALVWLLVVLVLPAEAAQRVEVSWPLAPDQKEMDVRDEAMHAGFLQGVVQQVGELLAAPMDSDQAELFRAYMQERVADLVTGYSVLKMVRVDEPPALDLVLSVTLNVPEIKNHLKELGILYTCTDPVATTMTLSGVNGTDWQRLEELKTLTGVMVIFSGQQADTDGVDLQIVKSDASAWRGELTAFDKRFSSRGRSLDEVWIALWKEYFKLDRVVAGTFHTVRFKVDGWYVPEGVSYFDTLLPTWKKLVEQADLVKIEMGAESLGGLWEVRTRDVLVLRARLERFLADKGLRLAWFEDSSEPGS